MGYPIITTPQDFNSYVAGVHHRLGFQKPQAFGIGAVRYNQAREVVEAIFRKLNINENFGSAAVFADVAHYRNGNVVYEPDFFDFKAFEQIFHPFVEHPEDHPNVAAMQETYRLMCSPYNMKPVIVFVGDAVAPPVNHPAYNAFMEQLAPLGVLATQ